MYNIRHIARVAPVLLAITTTASVPRLGPEQGIDQYHGKVEAIYPACCSWSYQAVGGEEEPFGELVLRCSIGYAKHCAPYLPTQIYCRNEVVSHPTVSMMMLTRPLCRTAKQPRARRNLTQPNSYVELPPGVAMKRRMATNQMHQLDLIDRRVPLSSDIKIDRYGNQSL